MKTNRYLISGWVEAFFTVLVLWGLNNVVLGYSAKVLEANIIVYACSAFASSALVLLLIGGRGPLARETMRSVDTWAYGFILLMNYIISLNLFAVVTSTEGSLIQRFSLIFSLLASWFFLARTPSRGQLMGALAIFIGIIFVCADIPAEKRGLIYGLIFVSGVFQAARVFVAEFHRPHAQAAKGDEGVRGRCRVVGFVMFIISALFWLVMFSLALAQGSGAESHQLMPGLPMLEDFFHTPSILFGMASGALLVAPIRLLEFSSTHIIKTENFLAVTSLSSLSTLFWEWATKPLTGLSLSELSGLDLWGGILITFGGFWMALSMMRRHNDDRERLENFVVKETQDLSLVEDSREIVANTFEHFKGDIPRSAEALGVSVKALEAIISDTTQSIGFRTDVLKNVARRYRKKVAASDALTGLMNRAAFMAALKAAAADRSRFSLLYLDLDKFKPVNDTYGHEAGDAVLQEIAVRINKFLPQGASASRLGGDEFAIILPNTDKRAAILLGRKFEIELSRPMVVTAERYLVSVGASFGLATSPEDGTDGEELLAAADKNMYGVKRGR